MKATLEFDLPIDNEEFEQASNGMKWAGLVWDIEQQLRLWVKHGSKFSAVPETLEAMRALISEEMFDAGLKFPS